jgi:hypothetical protein
MSIKIPYLRKDTSSTLLILSAAMALLLTSPMLFFNILLQPVQAQTTMTFKTPTPAEDPTDEVTLTFNAQGTASSSDSQTAKITNGTIQITSSSSGQILYTSRFISGTFTNNTNGGSIFANGLMQQADTTFDFTTYCSTAHNNPISVDIYAADGGGRSFGLEGPVECSSSQVGGTITQQSTNSMTGTTTTLDRDSDGDGIPDSSDRCTHNSNTRCFKEGGDTSTTTNPQESSSSTPGNQTR